MGKNRVVFSTGGKCYEVDLEAGTRKNLHTKMTRRIRWNAGVQFQWELKSGIWVDYDEEENEILAAAKSAGKQSVQYGTRGYQYDVDFEHMLQANLSVPSSTIRKVRISCVGITPEERAPRVSPRRDPEPAKRRVSGPKLDIGGKDAESKRNGGRHHSWPPSDPYGPSMKPQPKPAWQAGGASPDMQKDERSTPRRHSQPSQRASAEPHKVSAPARSPRIPPSEPGINAARGGAVHGRSPREPSQPPKVSPREPHRRPPKFAEAANARKRSASPNNKEQGPTAAGTATENAPKLPKGVEWPPEPPARKAAEKILQELQGLRGADSGERKKAYRAMCLKWHPDKNLDDEDNATYVFQFLQLLKEWFLGE